MADEPKKFVPDVPIDKIRVDNDPDDDDAYQRLTDLTRATAYADAYDPALYTLPELSLRDDGWHYAIAGGHRITMRRLLADRGVPNMKVTPAYVHFGLTRAREAELFEGFQVRQKPLSQYDLFKAMRARRHPETMAIDQSVKAQGFRVVYGGHNGAEISAISKLRLVYDRGNLDDTLFYLVAWRDEPLQIRGELLDGLSLFLANGRTRAGDPVDPERMIERLTTPLAMDILNEDGLTRAVKLGGGGGWTRGKCYAQAYEDFYNDGLPLGQRVGLYFDDDAEDGVEE